MKLPRDTLDSIPSLASHRGSTLSTNQVVNARLKLGKRVLDMAALSVARAKESGVDSDQDPRTALEEEGRQEDTSPKSNLEAGNNRHRGIVVLLDEAADGISHGVGRILGLAVGGSGSTWNQLLGRSNGWDNVGTGVCGDVKDRVDAVREERKRVLGHKEPDEGHH